MATAPDPLVVSVEVAAYFESQGLLSPSSNNKRKLSVSLLSSSSRSASDTTSASSTFTASSVSEVSEHVVIPDVLDSQETYEVIGLSPQMAADLWHRFRHQPAGLDESFLDFALDHVDLHPVADAQSGQDDWDGCLRAMGINDQLRTAILMPEFEDIRYTATCKFWVLESLVSTYNALRNLNDDLRLEQRRRQQHQKTGRKHADSVSETPSAPGPRGKKGQSSASSSTTAGPSTPTQSTQSGAKGKETSDVPKGMVQFADRLTESLPGHHMIWRAGDVTQAAKFCNQHTGEIDLESNSCNPGDFSGLTRLTYFTPQMETADRYACWRKHKHPISDIVIFQIAVPDAFIESLSVQYLWFQNRTRPSDEWKSLVWHSRRGKRLPKEMRWLDQKDLLIGHVASGRNSKYENLTSPTQIKESDLVTIDRDGTEIKSIQWAFRTYKARDGFEENCEGKVWFHSMGTFKVPETSE